MPQAWTENTAANIDTLVPSLPLPLPAPPRHYTTAARLADAWMSILPRRTPMCKSEYAVTQYCYILLLASCMNDWQSLRQAGNFYRLLHCAPGFGIPATSLGKRRFDNAHEWVLTTRPTSNVHLMQSLYDIGVKRFFKKLSEDASDGSLRRRPDAVRSI